MDFDKPKVFAEPISHYYASIASAMRGALEGYMQTISALCLAYLSMTICFTSVSIGFTFLRRQWKQFITHPQRFFRGTHGRFLHIVNKPVADDAQATTAYLYLTKDEFSALSEIAKEVLARHKVATCPTCNACTEQPLLYPVSLTLTPHVMLDHRKPLRFQFCVQFIIYYLIQSTSVPC